MPTLAEITSSPEALERAAEEFVSWHRKRMRGQAEMEATDIEQEDRLHELRLELAAADDHLHALHRGLEWLSLALEMEKDAHHHRDFFKRCVAKVKLLRAIIEEHEDYIADVEGDQAILERRICEVARTLGIDYPEGDMRVFAIMADEITRLRRGKG